MTADTSPPSLPDELQRYFWEYGTERPTMERSRHTVIRRLLEVGGWDAVTWLRTHVGDDELRRCILQRRGRGLSPKRLRFWELVLDLPGPRVDRWIAARRSNPWYRRTRARAEDVELEVESVDEGTLHGWADGVRLSLLEYRYPMLRTFEDWSEYGCRLACLIEHEAFLGSDTYTPTEMLDDVREIVWREVTEGPRPPREEAEARRAAPSTPSAAISREPTWRRPTTC